MSHNTTLRSPMAWKKLTSLIVVLVCRFTLFLFISVFSLLLQGMPNINTCFLTVFLSCVIPLPPVSFFTHAVDKLFSKVCLVIRAYSVLVTKAQMIFISIPCNAAHFVLYGWVEITLRYVINHIRFTIPKMANTASLKVFDQLLPWIKTLHDVIRMSCVGTRFFARRFSRFMLRIARIVLAATIGLLGKLVHIGTFFFARKALGLLFMVGGVFVCAPGLEPLPNLLATGHLYPGSLIRFQRCAKYDDRTACNAAFLEFSYSLWNLTRTGIFIIMCRTANRPSWKPPGRELAVITERCLTLKNKAYLQLLLCATGLPLLMNGHCLSQTVHNLTCMANLLLFMVTLNGYHRRTALMVYHTLCTVAMNAQSVLVAVYNMYRNLQTQGNDYITTLLYIIELYLMLLVLADSSARVINKVKNPELDIMSENI